MINNLDEAIRHYEEKANENKAEATKIAREKKPFLEYARCKQCANEHEQLAEWLKELKAYKEAPQGDTISRKALKDEIEKSETPEGYKLYANRLIDNAPTVEPEKVLIANVTFDEDKLKEIVYTEVIDKIKSGELLLKDERPQGEWIPVSERLPKYSGLYLISVDDLVTVANFTGTYFMHSGGGIRVKVNAWQPLLEPYKPYKKGGAE